MARQVQYTKDTSLSNNDELFGSDYDNGQKSANFLLSDVKDFILEDTDYIITEEVPSGFFVTVDQNGENIEASNLHQYTTTLASDVGFYSTDTLPDDAVNVTESDFGILVAYNTGNTWYFEVKEYVGRFYLPSFQGKSFTGLLGSGDLAVTGTIGDFVRVDGKAFYIDSSNNRVYRYELTPTGDVDNTWDTLNAATTIFSQLVVTAADNDNITLDEVTTLIGTNLQLTSVVTFDESIIVNGVENVINGDLRIGNPVEDDGTVHLYGSIYLDTNDNSSEALFFGRNPDDEEVGNFVSAVTDGTNLTWQGGGSVTHQNEINFQNAITVSDTTLAITGSGALSIPNTSITTSDVNAPIVPVIGNPGGAGNALTSISVGGVIYTIPSTGGVVAAQLPGLTEDLEGAAGAYTDITLFYGTEGVGTATYTRALTETLGDIAITSGETSFIIASADRTAFGALFDGRAGIERLFFINSTDTLPALNTIVSEPVYEILSFDPDSGAATFSNVIGGTINIGTPEVKLNSIPLDTEESGEQYLFVSSVDRTLHARELDIIGATTSIRYDRPSDNAVTGITSLEFTGEHNIDLTTDGAPVIDISGRLPIGDDNATASFSAVVFNIYVLGDISSNQMVTLPTPTAGDTIQFIFNNSDTGVWAATSTDNIEESSNNFNITETLRLTYINATLGWVVT